MPGSIATAMATSFKSELMTAVHNFGAAGNVFKCAVIKFGEAGVYGTASTNYSNITGNTDEVSSTGYTAGGFTLTNVAPTTSSTTAYTTFSTNPSWTGVTFNAEGCMIYNNTAGGNCCGTFDFGGEQSVTAGTFTILLPAATGTTAILRIQ